MYRPPEKGKKDFFNPVPMWHWKCTSAHDTCWLKTIYSRWNGEERKIDILIYLDINVKLVKQVIFCQEKLLAGNGQVVLEVYLCKQAPKKLNQWNISSAAEGCSAIKHLLPARKHKTCNELTRNYTNEGWAIFSVLLQDKEAKSK